MTSAPAWNGGEPLPGQLSISLPAASPASPLAKRAAGSSKRTNGGYGPRWPTSFASYDRRTCSWRTSQGSLFAEWETYSVTWPRAGMTRNGTAYRLRPSAPLTSATESSWLPTPNTGHSPNGHGRRGGSPTNGHQSGQSLDAMARTGLWPTPTASAPQSAGPLHRRPPSDDNLPTRVARMAMWPTPTVSDATGGRAYSKPPSREGGFLLKEITPGPLNPEWEEALMGFPPGWTAVA